MSVLKPASSTSVEEEEGDNKDKVVKDLDGISSHPEPLSSSMTTTLDLHAEQSSTTVVVASPTVKSSNTLERTDSQDNNAQQGVINPAHILPGLDSSNPLDFEGIYSKIFSLAGMVFFCFQHVVRHAVFFAYSFAFLGNIVKLPITLYVGSHFCGSTYMGP